MTKFFGYGDFSRAEANDQIIAEGSSVSKMFIVISGKLHVFLSDQNKRSILLGELNSGDCCGELNLIESGVSKVAVIVRTRGEIWSISGDQFLSYISENAMDGNLVLLAILRLSASRIQRFETMLSPVI